MYITRCFTAATATSLLAVLLAGCSTGPTTKPEVCNAFDELGSRVLHANGIWDNGIFRQAGTLAGVAERYQQANLSADVDRLKAISKSDSTSGAEIMNATVSIAKLCGHPLAMTSLFGG